MLAVPPFSANFWIFDKSLYFRPEAIFSFSRLGKIIKSADQGEADYELMRLHVTSLQNHKVIELRLIG